MTTVANLEVVIDANTTRLATGLRGAQGQVQNFAQRAGASMQQFGMEMTTLTAPLVAGLAAGVSVAADFEGVMAEIGARAGLTGAELDRVSDFALQMGAETAFSAQQAGDAFLQLLTSGQSVEEAFATLPAVLDAAAASGEDLGMTADMVTNIMASFQLEATDAAMVVDALARAAGASSADIGSLGEGFANVGGVASTFGMTVEDTAAVLAIFAENGIAGAEAGTQLRSMLLNMTRPTDTVQGLWRQMGISFYDAAGNARPLEQVIADLDVVLDQLPLEEQNEIMTQLAGSYGILGLTALRNGMSISEMRAAMDDAAGASDVAAARMDTFRGRVDSLIGSVETLAITALTPFMENTLTPLAEGLTEIVNGFTEWTEANPALTTALGGLVVVLAGVGVAALVAGTALKAIGVVLAMPMGGVLLFVAALTGLAAAAGTLDEIGGGIKKVADGIGALMNGDPTALRQISAGLNDIILGIAMIPVGLAEGVLGTIQELTGMQMPTVGQGFTAWAEAFSNAWLALELIIDKIRLGLREFALGIRLEIANWISGFRQDILDATGGTIDIAPNINMERFNVADELANVQIVQEITDELARQAAAGQGIDLSQILTFDTASGTISTSIANLITDPAVLAQAGPQFREALESALATAFITGDEQAQLELGTIALGFGIDPMAVQAEVEAQMAGVTYDATVDGVVRLTGRIDMTGIQNGVSAAMAGIGAVSSVTGAGFEAPTGQGQVPTFSGGGMMHHDGLAYLHAGERVLNPSETADYNRGGSRVQNVYLTAYGQQPYDLLRMTRRAASDASPA